MLAQTSFVARPVHPMLVGFPVACFAGALLTDCAYAGTTNMMWSDFSDWLLAAGMAVGVIGLIAGFINIVADRQMLRQRPVWPFVLGSLFVLSVAFLNNLVHSRDAWTSVVPMGLILSAATLLLILATGWLASSMAHRHAARLQQVEIR